MMGCFAYRPVEPGVRPVPSAARLRLSHERATELGALSGPDGTLEGTIVAWTADMVVVSPRLRPGVGVGTVARDGGFADLRIPASDVVAVSLKRLDRRKTALTVLGTVAATALLLTGLFAGSGGTPDTSGNPPGDVDLLPVVR